ncbi:MAG: respiratory nitrate reductase subunit gamma [Conexivisphaera sp.]
MNPVDLVLWASMPYVVISVFVLGHIYRYATDQRGWTSGSTEFLEKRWLRFGSQLFMWGILVVALGHLIGLLVPPYVTQALGVSSTEYHESAVALGGIAGSISYIGAWILFLRRLLMPRVRSTSSAGEVLILVLIIATMTLGLYNTLIYSALFGPYHYRVTIGAWIRSIIAFQPNPSYMVGVPATFQLHIALAYAVFLAWPFSDLVHMWSFPAFYLGRPWILYRRMGGR